MKKVCDDVIKDDDRIKSNLVKSVKESFEAGVDEACSFFEMISKKYPNYMYVAFMQGILTQLISDLKLNENNWKKLINLIIEDFEKYSDE